MGVGKGKIFGERDVYIDYPYEEVMYRWDRLEGKVYKKFYGFSEDLKPVPHDDDLFNKATIFGNEISRDEYLRGKEPESD